MNLTARDGQVFIQPNGPATKPLYFGKADVSGDLADSLGDITLTQRFDAVGNRVARLNVQGELSPIDYSITKYVGTVPDVFDKPTCRDFAVWFHQKCGGVQGNFANYQRSYLAISSRPTSVTRTNVARWADDSTQRTVNYSAMPPLYVLEVWDVGETAVTSTTLRDLVIVPNIECTTPCLEYSRFAVGNRTGAGDATSYTTSDKGKTWTQQTTDIFGNGNATNSLEVIQVNETTYRLIAGSSTNDAGNPLLIAYSDDEGTTWTNVNVGATNGEYILRRDALYAWDRRNVWIGTLAGVVYYSGTCGESWVKIADGFTSSDITAIRFMDSVRGWLGTDDGEIWYTEDGGYNWTQATTTPSAGTVTSIWPHRQNLVWVTDENGFMYVSFDCGVTWNERYLTVAVDAVDCIHFNNEYIGVVMASGDNSIVAITVDGGWTWETIASVGDTLTAVEMKNYYQLNVVGGVSITANMRGTG